jgi:RimJ/RimL family protein N-acetyltransferase
MHSRNDVRHRQPASDPVGLPREFANGRGELVVLQRLDQQLAPRLVEMYLAYRPRNSFQGLPPIKDAVCIRWVEGMIADAVNVVAVAPQGDVVGHTALFAIDPARCEMLVVVSPPLQNTGIGTELVRSAVQLAHDAGYEKIWLPVEATNVRARHVYKKCGFAQTAAGLSREVEMAIELANYQPMIMLDSMTLRACSRSAPVSCM